MDWTRLQLIYKYSPNVANPKREVGFVEGKILYRLSPETKQQSHPLL